MLAEAPGGEEGTYLLEQRFRYAYATPVRRLRHRLMVVPRAVHGDLRLVDHELTVSGGPVLVSSASDDFGNHVVELRASEVDDWIEFEVWSLVRRSGPGGTVSLPPASIGDPRLLAPTPLTRADGPLAEAAVAAVAGATAGWESIAPSRALESTWGLIRATNSYLEANEPWKAEPGPDVDTVLGNAVEALRIVAILVSPAVPSTAQRIWERLGLDGDVAHQRIPSDVGWGASTGGRPITKGEPLFPRIR